MYSNYVNRQYLKGTTYYLDTYGRNKMVKSSELSSSAKNLAKKHRRSYQTKIIKKDFAGIKDHNTALLKAYRTIDKQLRQKENMIPATEWLLDNFYMIEEQSKQIQLEIDKKFMDS